MSLPKGMGLRARTSNRSKKGVRPVRFPSQRRQKRKQIAKEHIDRLLELAVSEHSSSPDLADRHARIAWNISTRFNVRLKEKRLLFCHFCKQFIIPPTMARYRLSKRRMGMNITCLRCGRTYRKLFSKAK